MTASTPELAGSGTLLDALRRHALKGSPAAQSLRAKLGETRRDEKLERRELLATAVGVHAVFKSLRTVRASQDSPLPSAHAAFRAGIATPDTTRASTPPPQELQDRSRGDSTLLSSLLHALKEGYK